jgi:excinuclease UvrABC nuclease subunit
MNRLSLISAEPNELGMSLHWRYTADAIEATPDKPGVYAFFDELGRLILMGSATKSLRAIFQSHWKGLEGRSTCGAVYIAWDLSADPMTLEAELVQRYAKKFGRLPRRRVS